MDMISDPEFWVILLASPVIWFYMWMTQPIPKGDGNGDHYTTRLQIAFAWAKRKGNRILGRGRKE